MIPLQICLTIGPILIFMTPSNEELLELSKKTVVNLIKHLTIVIYDSRVILTRKWPILRL